MLTDRGLVRLRGLANPNGEQWQDLHDLQVATDDGPREATRFFLNGAEPVVTVETARGYRDPGHHHPPNQGRRRGRQLGHGAGSPTSGPAIACR